ncbi:MAG: hypothetical protein WC341_17910, partial [Bacteroidales bacterium]
MTTAIYEPRGRAREYAALACNIYAGCDHACTYCYAPSATFKQREVFTNSRPRIGIIQQIVKEAKAWTGKKSQVLLCFTCDPYQSINDKYGLTRIAIQTLHDNGFPICTLTKGGKRALPDMDLFRPYDA